MVLSAHLETQNVLSKDLNWHVEVPQHIACFKDCLLVAFHELLVNHLEKEGHILGQTRPLVGLYVNSCVLLDLLDYAYEFSHRTHLAHYGRERGIVAVTISVDGGRGCATHEPIVRQERPLLVTHHFFTNHVTKADKFGCICHRENRVLVLILATVCRQVTFLDKKRHNVPVQKENVLLFVHGQILGLLGVQKLECRLKVVHHLSLVFLATMHAFGN